MEKKLASLTIRLEDEYKRRLEAEAAKLSIIVGFPITVSALSRKCLLAGLNRQRVSCKTKQTRTA